MKLKRSEFHIVNYLVEYEIPDTLKESETNAVIDGFYDPEPLPYPRKILAIDSEHSKLFAVISPHDGPSQEISFEEFLKMDVTYHEPQPERFSLDIVSHELAVSDIEDNYKTELLADPALREKPAYKKLIDDRKKFLRDRLIVIMEQLSQQSKNQNETT